MNTFFIRKPIGLGLALWLSSIFIASAQPVIQYTPVISSGLSAPIDIVNAGDAGNRLFIVQRGGTIRVYNQSFTYLGNFLTVTGISGTGEGGLLSMAFHPSYETNGFFFVYYTLPDLSLEVARYQVNAVNPNLADPGSKVVVLNIPHPTFSNHNGGKLLFGADGYLYLGTGDGGGGGDPNGNAQNGNSLLGKMLRLNVTTTATAPYYTIPPDNPYIGNASVLDEIWAMGLRNPWRWSFDRANNDMWIADVGEGSLEEVNYRAAGTTGGINYGWRCYEGNQAYNTSGCQPAGSYITPIFTYGHNNNTGGFSITGGHVYRGPDYPALTGFYICADYVSGNQWTIGPNGSGGWNVFQQNAAAFPGNIVAFGEAENGTLYAASLSGNQVYRVELNTVLPLILAGFTGTYRHGTSYLQWHTSMEQNLDYFEIEYSFDGTHYEFAGKVKALNKTEGASYWYEHTIRPEGKILYRLRMTDFDGQYRYSNIITLHQDVLKKTLLYPSVVTNGILNIEQDEGFHTLELMSTNGAILRRYSLSPVPRKETVSLGYQAAGMYWVRLRSDRHNMVQKIVIQ